LFAKKGSKSPKSGQNRRKAEKIAEKPKKSPKSRKNRRKAEKIAENGDLSIDPLF
jgi:hypothetical protein